MAKELILYFPVNKIAFNVNCDDLHMSKEHFEVSDVQVKDFLSQSIEEDFISNFESKVLNE